MKTLKDSPYTHTLNSPIIELLEYICDSEEITLMNLDGNGRFNAVAMVLHGDESDHKGIFCNPNLPPFEQTWAISHEIAHHVMGHFRDNRIKDDRQACEEEARSFAAAFTAIAFYNHYADMQQSEV